MPEDVGFDYIYWEDDGSGNLRPRLVALIPVYPEEDVTLVGSPTYGPTGTEYTPSYDPGQQIDAPVLVSATPGNQKITLEVLINAAGDPAYILYKRSCSATWSSPSETFKLTEDGNIDITSLVNYREYQFQAISIRGDFYSRSSNILTSTPIGTNTIRLRIRDKAASVALKVAKKLGVQIVVTNPGDTAATVWALIDNEGNYNVTTLGPSDERKLVFVIPRQTGFPFDMFKPSIKITHGGLIWGVNNIAPDNEDIDMASTFRFETSSLSYQAEIGVDDSWV